MTDPKITKLASVLEGMSLDEVDQFFENAVKLSQEKIAEENKIQVANKTELQNLSDDELTQELASYNPRTGDKERKKIVATELKQRQQAAALEASTTKMEFADWQQLQEQRAILSSEIKALGRTPSRNMQEIRKKTAELQKLIEAEPDVILPKPRESDTGA